MKFSYVCSKIRVCFVPTKCFLCHVAGRRLTWHRLRTHYMVRFRKIDCKFIEKKGDATHTARTNVPTHIHVLTIQTRETPKLWCICVCVCMMCCVRFILSKKNKLTFDGMFVCVWKTAISNNNKKTTATTLVARLCDKYNFIPAVVVLLSWKQKVYRFI